MAFSRFHLLFRTLCHYWRVQLAVALAAAIGVAVLAGSFLVGASVKASLRALTFERLGPVRDALVSELFFQEDLARRLNQASGETSSTFCSAIIFAGSVRHADSNARASQVQIVGAGPDFWDFMGGPIRWDAFPDPEESVVLNEALAREIQAKEGDEILVRAERPSAIGRNTYLGDRDATVATLRLTVVRILPEQGIGRFGLFPSQQQPLNLFIPLKTLQERLGQEGRVNTLLSSRTKEAPQVLLDRVASLDDLGLQLTRKTSDRPKVAVQPCATLEGDRIFLAPAVEEAARRSAAELGLEAAPVLTYLANTLRAGGRTIPYSVVTGVDQVGPGSVGPRAGEIFLNQEAADDLQTSVGCPVGLTYYVPTARGELREETTTFTLARIVPMQAPWADPTLAPNFPGLADKPKLSNWDAPFKIDHNRIRARDDEYWEDYRATPKAFVSLETARAKWGNPFGNLTAVRFREPGGGEVSTERLTALSGSLRRGISAASVGMVFLPVLEQGLAASQGASDFGQLFVGFSLFILVSVAALIQILFRLGMEGRARQFGLLRAVGFTVRQANRLLLTEAALVAAAGGALGLLLAVGYAVLMVRGLNTWWVGSIGSPFVRFALSPGALAGGFGGGWGVALIASWWAVRDLAKISECQLLAGRIERPVSTSGARRGPRRWTVGLGTLSLLLLVGSCLSPAQLQAALFFATAAALLATALAGFALYLRSEGETAPEQISLTRIARAAARRQPGRNLLIVALVATATFLIVAVGANRQTSRSSASDKRSGTGGFTLLAETAVPLYQPIQTILKDRGFPFAEIPEGGLYALRLRPGDDASCQNLYRATEPRLLGVEAAFIERGGFTFSASEAHDPEAKADPWKLLERPREDGAVPVIGDYTTVYWLLHLGLGKEITVADHRLRIVGLLNKSVFQSELVMSAENFERLFPEHTGWSVFALDTSGRDATALGSQLEEALEDYGFDATSASDRLDSLMTVENTYLATFQSLGGLGLLLGTLGLALVLVRNLLERRRELALLQALGFRFRSLLWLALSENLFLLTVGMGMGVVCALLAIAPALLSRAAVPDWLGLGGTLAGVFLFGAVSALLSATLALRVPVQDALREE
ncbi:MAG TPA: ABC transporter permease [Candidatus Sumerlaeota bacterium]|nr:ABC transporter permease [Candidatus Sumerlaeota bacterium]